MAVYKVNSEILVECKKCLIETSGTPKEGESLLSWAKRRTKFRKRSEKLIKLLEENYGI